MRRLILYIIGIVVTAMGAHANPRYCARYVKEHLLYQRGAETNVIDIDMEWPEMVDGSAAVPLQRLLTRTLLGNEHSTLDSAYTRFLARFGKPVTRQFDSIPDDSRFCYVGAWEYKGDNAAPELSKEPLSFENIELATRSYK